MSATVPASLLQALSLRLPKKQAAMLLTSIKSFHQYKSPLEATYETSLSLKKKLDQLFKNKSVHYVSVVLENGNEWRSEDTAGKTKKPLTPSQKSDALYRFLNQNPTSLPNTITIHTDIPSKTKDLKKQLHNAIAAFVHQKIKNPAI